MVLLALLWGAVLLGGIVAGNNEPLHNDVWIKVLQGRSKHRMRLPGQTMVVFSHATEVTF